MLLILMVYDHYQYDTFHPKGDETYRILTYKKGTKGNFTAGYATSPLPIGKVLTDQYASVREVVRMNNRLRGEVRSPHLILTTEDYLNSRSLFVDPSFFHVFGFTLKEGDPNTALEEPFSMVLTEEMANLLFPEGDALNATISFEDHGDYKVTGIMNRPPGKSHMNVNMLASMSTMPTLASKGIMTEEYDQWETYWMNYNYLVVQPDTDIDYLTSEIEKIVAENMEMEDDQPGLEFELQAVTDIVPGGILSNEISAALPWFMLIFFCVLGLILIITASINYANLSIAKSINRSKEVAIRKIHGATRPQIIQQFLMESLLLAAISMMLAMLLYRYLIHAFNEIWVFTQVGYALQDHPGVYLFFIVFCGIVGLLTGMGPSMLLSRVPSIDALRGLQISIGKKLSGFRRLFGKRFLLGAQFSIALFMLITLLLLNEQADLLTNSAYGFEEDETFYIDLQGHDPELVTQTFGEFSGVNLTSYASHHPAVGRSYGAGVSLQPEEDPITIYWFAVDNSYPELMKLEWIAGGTFPKDVNPENEKFVILNELAVQRLGFESAQAAIGQSVFIEEESLVVTGVVKDYHWEPLMKSIRPMMLRHLPDRFNYAYFNITPSAIAQIPEKFESKWQEFDSQRLFKGGYLNEEMDTFYLFFYDLKGIIGLMALLALLITCLGFLGMVRFRLQSNIKEIGVRSVLGATFGQLSYSLTRKFLKTFLISAMITLPAAFAINYLWINQMEVSITIGPTHFLLAIAVIAFFVMATIVSQVWSVMRKEPVQALRTE